MNYTSQSPTYQQQLSRNSTPLSSATATPTNYSPILRSNSSSSTALPNLTFQTRQLRPPKSPLYIPAVLRPTERPSRYSTISEDPSSNATSPLTPPQSYGNSFDGIEAGILNFTGPDGIPRRFVGDDLIRCGVTRVVTDEWNEDLMEDVTGAPTQNHWKVRRIVSIPASCTKLTELASRTPVQSHVILQSAKSPSPSSRAVITAVAAATFSVLHTLPMLSLSTNTHASTRTEYVPELANPAGQTFAPGRQQDVPATIATEVEAARARLVERAALPR